MSSKLKKKSLEREKQTNKIKETNTNNNGEKNLANAWGIDYGGPCKRN